ncbi:hypothetical protein ScPMuIL_001239 [Solemya velum]
MRTESAIALNCTKSVTLLKMSRSEEGVDMTGVPATEVVDGENGKKPAPKRPIKEEIKLFFKAVYRVLKSLIGLVFLLVIYTVVGAFIFEAIESPNEAHYKSNVMATRRDMVSKLLNASQLLKHKDTISWGNDTEKLLLNYEKQILKAYKNGINTPSDEQVWTFWGALFFCGTTYTTIGYGHIAPITDLGRLLAIVYAVVGIPLAMIVLADLGKRFTLGLKYLWAFVRRYYQTGYCRKIRKPFNGHDKYDVNAAEDEAKQDIESGDTDSDQPKEGSKVFYGYEIDDEFNVPITVAGIILLVYIIFGGCMYTFWEEWTYIESFYFVFISLSTIGFGDVLPEHPKYFIISSIYVFVGLSLVSMVITVAIEFFSKTMDRAKVEMDKQMDRAKEKMVEVGKQIDKAKDKVTGTVVDFKDTVADTVADIGQNIKDVKDEVVNIIKDSASECSTDRERSATPDIKRKTDKPRKSLEALILGKVNTENLKKNHQ